MSTSPSSSSTSRMSTTRSAWLIAVIVLVRVRWAVLVGLLLLAGGFGRTGHDRLNWYIRLAALISPIARIGCLVPAGCAGRVGQRGQREAEPRSGRDARVEPDPAAVVLDDLPAHGQPDAGAR